MYQRRRACPKSLRLQQGSKRTNPDELTPVSDSGKRKQLAPPLYQRRRACPKSLGLQQGSKRTNPDELTPVSDSGE
nr:hypothetical protein [Yersinia alsatica]